MMSLARGVTPGALELGPQGTRRLACWIGRSAVVDNVGFTFTAVLCCA
jgi:hypothetical protein